MHQGRGLRRLAIPLLALVLGTVALTACLPPPPPPTVLAISTSPGLYPTFSPSITDYVARCGDGSPVSVSVEAPSGTLVSVDGQPFASGRFTATVSRTAGQDFAIVLLQKEQPATTHFVRCLPSDFPFWYFQRTGDSASEFTIIRPLQGFNANYPMILDRNGVPVWWGPKQNAILSEVTAAGHVVSVLDSGAEERTLDGKLVQSVPVQGGIADGHDWVILPNGHFVMMVTQTRTNVDLSPVGGPADTSILDQVLEEIDPATGDVVWTWDPIDHMGVDEMDPQWFSQYITGGTAPYDLFHWNSIEWAGDGYILSFRHADAVYKIDTNGDIVWKLGGTATPESLTVVGDPVFTGGSHLGGQHDARLQADGSVSLFDNGTNLGRAPRVVRYAIDTNAKTATLVETVTDDGVPSSFCCGSARKVTDGDWVIGWGGTGSATEAVNGERRTAYAFVGGLIVYRLVPLASGSVTLDALRAGMDAQFPDLGATEAVDPGNPMPFPP